jgi:hypothetical protein
MANDNADDMKTTGARPPFLFVLFGTAAHGAPQHTEPHLVVQPWSVKGEIRRDFDGMLAEIARLGFQGVEFAGQFGPYRQDPAGLKSALDKNGRPRGRHAMGHHCPGHAAESDSAAGRGLDGLRWQRSGRVHPALSGPGRYRAFQGQAGPRAAGQPIIVEQEDYPSGMGKLESPIARRYPRTTHRSRRNSAPR